MKQRPTTGTLALLALLGTGVLAPAGAPVAPNVSAPAFGAEELVMTKAERDASGLFYWPDGNISLLPVGPNAYRFFAANSGNVGIAEGSLERPAQLSARPSVPIQAMKRAYDYAAGGSVWRDPVTGTLLMVYHAEAHIGGDPTRFYATLGLARSVDGGDSWIDLGEIIRHAAAPESLPSCLAGAEVGGGPLVENGDYLYVYFRDGQPSSSCPPLWYNHAVARAKTSDVRSAAGLGEVTPWSKYYQGQWTEPGLGGHSTYLENGNPDCGFGDVTFNTYSRRYMLVCATWLSSDHTRLEYSDSVDGLTWSPRVLIADDGPGTELFYPSFVSGGSDPRRTGEILFIYYTSAAGGSFRWATATLARRRVTFPGLHVDAISPVTGSTAGGTRITVTGKAFAAGATVSIGGSPATDVTVISPSALTATTGPHARGTVDATVTVPGGGSDAAPRAFFYEPPATPSRLFTLLPCRLIDTRNASLAQGLPLLVPLSSRTYATNGRCGIPPTATALSVNLTVTEPSAPGSVTLYPGDGLSASSSLNFRAGQTRANNAIVGLAPDGLLGVRNGSNGTVHMIVDVNGYFE